MCTAPKGGDFSVMGSMNGEGVEVRFTSLFTHKYASILLVMK